MNVLIRRTRPLLAFGALFLIQSTVVSQRASAEQATLTVFASANATAAFTDIAMEFEQMHPGVTVKTSYAGAPILTAQLEQGAAVDVFLSADLLHIQKLRSENLVGNFRRVSKGHEVIVVPKSNPAGVRSLRDLGRKGVKLLLGQPDLPIGEYARKIFLNANRDYGAEFSQNTLANAVSLETNVKQILQKTALGEADAGIVYATDVEGPIASNVSVIEIPQKYIVPTYNYIAVVKASVNQKLANDLVRFALSPRGQSMFAEHHYDAMRS